MNRILSALLLISMVVTLLPSHVAQAQSGNNLNQLLGAEKADSITATDDALWLLSGDKLWRWQPQEQQPELMAQDVPNAFQDAGNPKALGYLMAHSNQLYSLQLALGTLSTVVLDGGIQLKDTMQYPMDLLLDADGQPRMVKNCFMNQDGTWLLVESGNGLELLLLDKKGKVNPFNTKDIRSIAPYKGNQLLVLVQEEGKSPVLAEFNPGNGKTKTLIKVLPMGADGLCYDAASNTAYYFAKGEIIAHPKMGKAKSVAYLPSVFLYRSPVLLKGHLAASLTEGVFIRSLTGDKGSKPTVRVYGLDEFTLNKVRAMLPDIKITVSERYLSAMELAQAVLSDSFPYDVAVLSTRNPQLYSLMEKGFLAKLEQFPVTANVAKRVYPVLLEPVTFQENLYALPASIFINDFGYKKKYLDQVGMSVDELPRDILSVMDFLERWQERYAAFDGEVLPASFTSKRAVVSEMIGLYIRQYQLHGLQLSFDTPLFRQMMEKINQLDDQYLSSLRDNFQDGWTPKVIIETGLNLRDLARNRQTRANADGPTYPLCINLEPGMPTVYPYGADYAAVMTKSPDQDAAARVVAAISQADWAQDFAPVVFSDYQPLVSDNYLENKAAMESNEQSLKAQIKKAEGAEKSNLEQTLIEAQARLIDYEKERFVTTKEELAIYRRDILPYLKPLGPSLHEDSNMQMTEDLSFIFLIRQMMEGTIEVEQFIQQAEQRLQLMEGEEGK